MQNSILPSKPVSLTPLVRLGLAALASALLLWCYSEARGLSNLSSAEARSGHNSSFDSERSLLSRGDTSRKEVALTIDDGPHVPWAVEILRTLKKNRVHATFFVVGRKVQIHPEILREMLAEGNEIGNHSMTHPRLDTLTERGVRNELSQCAQAVFDATGTKMRLMRPPGLRYTDKILQVARSMHYITVEENIAVGDYILPGDRSWYRGSPTYAKHVSDVERNVFKQLKNGAIIVLHDMPVTSDALDTILKGIKRRGYRIVTVSQMLDHLR